jgi:hypothetical protein
MHNLLLAVTTLFSAFTGWVVWQTGFLGFFQQLLASPVGWQVLADIAIALFLVLAWMKHDARARARRFWPWALLTVALGSIGPLLYLLSRPRASRAEPAAAA